MGKTNQERQDVGNQKYRKKKQRENKEDIRKKINGLGVRARKDIERAKGKRLWIIFFSYLFF